MNATLKLLCATALTLAALAGIAPPAAGQSMVVRELPGRLRADGTVRADKSLQPDQSLQAEGSVRSETWQPSEESLARADSLRLAAGLTDEAFSPRELLRRAQIETQQAPGVARRRLTAFELPRKPLYEPVILGWQGGALTGASSQELLRGLMAVNQARLLAIQRVGNVTFAGGVTAQQTGWRGGQHTSFGFDASVSWQITEQLGVRAFGSVMAGGYGWYRGAPGVTPAMTAYLPFNDFGATLTWRFSRVFALEGGVRTYYDIMRRRYRAVPVLSPMFSIPALHGAEIGFELPLGEILYSIFSGGHSGGGWGGFGGGGFGVGVGAGGRGGAPVRVAPH